MKKNKTIKKNPQKKQVKKEKQSNKIQELSSETVTGAGYIIFYGYCMYLLYRYIRCFWWLEPVVITNNLILIIFLTVLPIILWCYSTKFDRYHYHNIKRRNLCLVIFAGLATVFQPLIYICNILWVSKIMQLTPTENVTKGMILMLARGGILVVIIMVFLVVGKPMYESISTAEMMKKIDSFRITHYMDIVKDRRYTYDMQIMNDLKTGKKVYLNFIDRLVHVFINGASGTGKTSSTITRAIECDLNTKVRNRKKREKELLKMVKAGECVVIGGTKKITEHNVKPRKEYLKKYQEIYKKYPDCGMTVMAPNNSLNNDIIKMCNARKITVNVVDPAKIYTEKYARRLGINPFFISLDLDEKERAIAIADAATNFSEVIVAANETQRGTDQYFRDINTSVTTNIATACMLANNINKKQTSIIEIQRCIGSFKALEPYISVIEDYYEINIEADDVSKKNKNDVDMTVFNKNREESNRSKGYDNIYYETIHFIKQELLGSGAEKLFDQARGLRNLINKLLNDPRIRDLLIMPTEKSINFAEILKNNEITVVNTAIEFNQQSSTAFGLFFMLNHAVQVKKRKENERTPHFLIIDEAAQYMHKMYDDMITLYRQYCVAVTLAMQSTSQMEKSDTTKYLKPVIMGCGTQIVFGRVSAEEMKLYSELAGKENIEMLQKQSSKTSLFVKNASENYGERTMETQKNVQEALDIRNRDFQEVTVFTIKDGRVLNAFAAKLRFVKKSTFKDQHITLVDWSKYVLKRKKERVLTKPAVKVKTEQEKILEARKSRMSVIEKNAEKPMTQIHIEEAYSEEPIFNASIFEDEPISEVVISSQERNSIEDMLKMPIEEDIPAGEEVENSTWKDPMKEMMEKVMSGNNEG